MACRIPAGRRPVRRCRPRSSTRHAGNRSRSSCWRPSSATCIPAREPDARLRPRNPRHHHAMHTAFHTRSRTHELDPLVPLTPFAAPVVVFRAFAPAARATQRGLPAPDARHQDRSVAQRGIVDGHVLDDHALDVEQTFEYVLHKAFSVVLFLGRKTNLQETPLTPS